MLCTRPVHLWEASDFRFCGRLQFPPKPKAKLPPPSGTHNKRFYGHVSVSYAAWFLAAKRCWADPGCNVNKICVAERLQATLTDFAVSGSSYVSHTNRFL